MRCHATTGVVRDPSHAQEVVIEAPTPKPFEVTAGHQTDEVMGRSKAVAHAKDVSKRWHGPVHVERADERVRMTFRRGELLEYRYETRGRKGRGRMS